MLQVLVQAGKGVNERVVGKWIKFGIKVFKIENKRLFWKAI